MGASLGNMLGAAPSTRKDKGESMKSGANFKDRSLIKAYLSEGRTVAQISALLRIQVDAVERIVDHFNKDAVEVEVEFDDDEDE
jgi:hypothetical protein